MPAPSESELSRVAAIEQQLLLAAQAGHSSKLQTNVYAELGRKRLGPVAAVTAELLAAVSLLFTQS
jgi:hypothetical protein